MRHLWTMPLSALLLSGCVSLLPSYNVEIADNVDATGSAIAKMAALYDVSATPPTFAQFEPLYVDALAGITSAERVAASQSKLYDGKPSAAAAQTISRAIGTCKTALLAQLAFHRKKELEEKVFTKTSFDQARLAETCNAPAVMETALKERKP